MIQNELQRVVAELDELISRDEERQDYCSETGPNEAMRRVVALTEIRNIVARLVAAARRIEAAQAVAPGGWTGLVSGFVYKLGVHTPTVTVSFKRDDWAARDRFAAMIAAAPASEVKGSYPREAIAWRTMTPYGIGYSFASVEVMNDMADFLSPASAPTVSNSAAERVCMECGTSYPDGKACPTNHDAEQEQAGELPELPEPKFCDPGIDTGEVTALYTAEQMREHAREYAELVLEAALLRRAARVEVTDAMVERALHTYRKHPVFSDTERMRAALNAALEPKK